jgi:site-specific DNA recombinase
MSNRSQSSAPRPQRTERPTIRCAIYTRKSSEEGLEQEFNSLDAQRASAEAYIASQKAEGWACLPDRYDDGGYTGGNMERPALTRLLDDIRVGKVDCVVVYKVDRLSRSLMDFARMMGEFEKFKVSFVSVTQQFNTTHSMGRLTLNILLSFAQFERELVSERTRDKIALARQRGKYAGGRPVLGYDAVDTRLVVNEEEACRVREIFATYLRTESIGRTVAEANAKGWTTKRWTTKDGRVMGGVPLAKSILYTLLTNVLYIGKVRHGSNVYDGEQPAIVDEETWAKAQALLRENGRTGGAQVMNRYGAVLKGILRCGPCGKPMIHSCTRKESGQCYRYYVCFTAQSSGYHACPSKSLPAEQIERFVFERVRALGRDRDLVTLVLDQARRQDREQAAAHEGELTILEREMRWLAAETRRASAERSGEAAERLADLAERTRAVEARAASLRDMIAEVNDRLVTREQVEASAVEFEPLWRSLSPRERSRLLRLVVRRVEFDGARGEVAVTFHPETEWLAKEAVS